MTVIGITSAALHQQAFGNVQLRSPKNGSSNCCKEVVRWAKQSAI